jgi:hypothetical protein
MGGKLPGIGLGEAPTGCKTNMKGFTIRPMWRGYINQNKLFHGDNCTTNKPSFGSLYNYLYYENNELMKKCGVSYYNIENIDACEIEKKSGFQLVENVWHTLTYKVKCNDMGEHNGYIEMFFDGKPVFYLRNLNLLPQDCPIEKQNWVFLLHVFRGGSTQEWSVQTNDDDSNQSIYFSYFQMTNNPNALFQGISSNISNECAIINPILG